MSAASECVVMGRDGRRIPANAIQAAFDTPYTGGSTRQAHMLI